MKKIILITIVLNSFIIAKTINIAVAANVSYAIPTLIKEFNTIYPDTKVRVTLGSSGKLTAQIKNNAPYDIFMSANMKYPNYLYNNNIAITKPKIYAQGGLAYFSTKSQDFTQGINILLNKKIKKIAIANPKTAPYGKATIEALKNSNILDKITKKLIYGESISQTVSYAMIAADIGFIAKSSLYSSTMTKFKKNINWIDLDSKLYTPIKQGIVILENGKEKDDVKDFYDFVLSKKAKEIFLQFGYIL